MCSSDLISNGVVQVSDSNALGYSGSYYSSNVTVQSGASLELSGGITIGSYKTFNLTGSGPASGGALVSTAGTNTVNGAITLGSGSVRINASSGSSLVLDVPSGNGISGNYNIAFGGGGDISVNDPIATGGGTLTKDGAGRLTLAGANSYSGATTISAGVLRAANNTALGSTAGGVTIASGAALEFYGGISIGAEAINVIGTGISSGGAIRNVSGNNSLSGDITLTGASRINSDSGTLTLTGDFGGAFSLTFGGAGTTQQDGAINISTAGVTKDGSGSLLITSANTYKGGTIVSNGTLTLGNRIAIGSGTLDRKSTRLNSSH